MSSLVPCLPPSLPNRNTFAQAVLLKKKGFPLKQVVEITGKSEDAIEDWMTKYNQHGLQGLKTKQRAVPPRAMLTNDKKDNLKQLITDHKPSALGLAGDFWSVPTLKQLVKDTYKVTYKNDKAYRDLLHYCGFSYQKAEYVDRRKNNQSQGHFKKRFEKKLKKGTISMWW